MITLTNVGADYDTILAARGLGISRIDFRGSTQITLDVYHQKVGTGTITYQLWNETDQQEICTVSDSAGNGTRFISSTTAVNINGVKLCRIRVKSTVAADDPIFYGGAVSLNSPTG